MAIDDLRIKEKLSKGLLEEAIEDIKSVTVKNSSFNKELILLSVRIKNLNIEARKGIIENDKYRLEINKINSSTLDLLENLINAEKGYTIQKPLLKRRIIIPIIFGVVLLGLAVIFWNKYYNSGNLFYKEPIQFNLNQNEEILELNFHSEELKIKHKFEINSSIEILELKESLINYYDFEGIIDRNDDYESIIWEIENEMIPLKNEKQSLKEGNVKSGNRITLKYKLVSRKHHAH